MTALYLRTPEAGKVPKPLRDVLDVRAIEAVQFLPEMREADFMATTSGLTAPIERQAARMGTAMVCVLPQAGEWLNDVIMRRLTSGRSVSVYYRGGE